MADKPMPLPMSLAEALKEAKLDYDARKNRRRWGCWKREGDTLVGPHGYWLPCVESELESSAEVLDWIIQILHKPWADDACVANLVRALDDRLSLQANYCSFGQERHNQPHKE